jgi:AAA+ ATPase superfamily predicted ATPase
LQQIWHEFLPSINWLTGIYWVLKGLQVCVYCVVYIDNRIVFDTNTYAQLQFFSSNGSNLFSVTSSENVPTQPKLLSTLPLIDKDEKQYTGQIKVLFLSTARPITTQHQWCLLWLIYFA